MSTSLYDLSVTSYVQILEAVSGYLEKGLAHCKENHIEPNSVLESRLYPNMLPFRFQILSIVHHSRGAIDGIKKGVFNPPPSLPDLDYVGFQKLVSDAKASLSALSVEEVNALAGKEVVFQMGKFELPYTAENFVMSFSFPNFYFHATTAYGILRSIGVHLGKRDFMGMPRMKT